MIKGSDTLGAKMVPQLAEAYKAAGNEVTFEIAAEGSSTAFTPTCRHLLQISECPAVTSRTSETDAFTAKGMEIKDWTAAYDMIGVIVNEKSSIEELTTEQIEGIFTGDISDWSEVGGDAGPYLCLHSQHILGNLQVLPGDGNEQARLRFRHAEDGW